MSEREHSAVRPLPLVFFFLKLSRLLFIFPSHFIFIPSLLHFHSSHSPPSFFVLAFSQSHRYWHIHIAASALAAHHSCVLFPMMALSAVVLVALDLVVQSVCALAVSSTMIHISTIASCIRRCLFLSIRSKRLYDGVKKQSIGCLEAQPAAQLWHYNMPAKIFNLGENSPAIS